jgi:hypothetical protein
MGFSRTLNVTYAWSTLRKKTEKAKESKNVYRSNFGFLSEINLNERRP